MGSAAYGTLAIWNTVNQAYFSTVQNRRMWSTFGQQLARKIFRLIAWKGSHVVQCAGCPCREFVSRAPFSVHFPLFKPLAACRTSTMREIKTCALTVSPLLLQPRSSPSELEYAASWLRLNTANKVISPTDIKYVTEMCFMELEDVYPGRLPVRTHSCPTKGGVVTSKLCINDHFWNIGHSNFTL